MAPEMDAPFLKDSYLMLECRLERIIEGFGEFGLIAGKITHVYVDPESMRVSEADDGDMISDNPIMAYLPFYTALSGYVLEKHLYEARYRW